MRVGKARTVRYQRANFVTLLPRHYRYSLSHYWLARQRGDLWRVGLTKFATRMLGEMVDHGFEIEAGAQVKPGQILGWVEGFKAMADVYSVAEGRFAGANPALRENLALIHKDPYHTGWLYAIQGQPDARCLDVAAYGRHLDRTIDLILQKRAPAARPPQ
jgi:glycine cleavage system H protein